ncbi:MAG TPA: alpha/beta fold hydrolase [Gemmatimonadaceae bacterium]|jgi:pimeloyl-ACP methyl ester carboxylesterase
MTIAALSPLLPALVLVLSSGGAVATTPPAMTRHDFYVTVKSTAPAMHGGEAKIFVREVAQPSAAGNNAPSKGVVLFVHGAGTPAEVAFDVEYEDYSWMEFLARAGFDVFAMDMTGYGRSTRPPAMSDPCNLSHTQQAEFIPAMIKEPCAASFPNAMTTMSSDWDDVAAVVDHLRALRHVERVSLIGWSQGGPRAGGYAAQHPDKVDRLVVLAPAYSRDGSLSAPSGPVAMPGGSMNTQTQTEFAANWDRQVGCAGQYDPAVSKVIWKEMLSSDSVGATWGPGVRRAPQVPTWGFNQAVVSKMTTPFLMVSGANDKQVPQEHVRELYTDLGSTQKVFIDLACSSHNAMWEKNHLLLFQASLEWLSDGKVGGVSEGMLKRGY